MQTVSPLYWSFIAALSLSAALSLVLIGYVWRRRALPGAMPLLGMLISVIFWSVGYIIEYMNSSLEIKLFAWNISYVGVMMLPVMLFAFSLRFTHRGQWLTPRIFALLLIVPLATLILQWTKDLHSLMFYDVHLLQDGPFLLVAKKYGSWAWVAVTYNYGLILTSLSVLLFRLFSPPRLFIGQAIYLLIVIIVPVYANLEYFLRLLPMPRADWTPAAFAVSAIALTLAISRHSVLEITPVARESAIELMSEGFLVLDDKDRVIDFNKSMKAILGMPASSIHGKPLPGAILTRLKADGRYSAGADADVEINLAAGDRHCCYSVHFSPFYTGNSSTPGHVLVVYDITQRKHEEETIKYIAYYDQLTALPNRALFTDRAELALSSAGRHKRMLAIMVLDIDMFKKVNDTYGHAAGDQVLQEISIRFSNSVRKVDTVARLGGDEFIMLLPEISGEQTVDTVIQRIMEALREPFNIDEKELRLTVSIGAAIYPGDGFNFDTLMRNADTAMYQVKRSGRNGYQRYSVDMAGEVSTSAAE
jgi:diguanylate cyclase (GGDEF)-like protein/PAS domain S-box-containing protein